MTRKLTILLVVIFLLAIGTPAKAVNSNSYPEVIQEPTRNNYCYTTDESGNCGKSDVSITSISVTEEAYVDNNNQLQKDYAVAAEITNLGKTSVEHCEVQAYLGNNLGQEISFARLDYKKKYLFYTHIPLSNNNSLSPLEIKISACANSTNDKNNKNNTKTVKITPKKYSTGSGLPDLQIGKVEAKQYYDFNNNKTLTYLVNVNNMGAGAPGQNEIGIVDLSLNAVYVNTPIELKRMASKSNAVVIFMQKVLEYSYLEGKNLISIKADIQNTVKESNENNNIKFLTVAIQDGNYLKTEQYSDKIKKVFVPLLFYTSKKTNSSDIQGEGMFLGIQVINIGENIANSASIKVELQSNLKKKYIIEKTFPSLKDREMITLFTGSSLTRKEIKGTFSVNIYLNGTKVLTSKQNSVDLFYATK